MSETPTTQFRHRVLVLFPSAESRGQLLRAVNAAGIVPRLSDSFEDSKRALEESEVDVVICEDRVPAEIIEKVLRLTHNHGRVAHTSHRARRVAEAWHEARSVADINA